jgi:serine/threonine protein kinase/lipoprotein NlpI
VAGQPNALGPESISPPSYTAARSLKRELLQELKAGWGQGQPVRAEDLLPRWPVHSGEEPDTASLLFEEYRQRREHPQIADPPSLREYSERFPALQDSLARLVRQHDVMRSLGGASASGPIGLALPDTGDELFGFRLRDELGRGAFARVFLAEQAILAGRPVVVKVSAIEGDEPQTLAQLQHTHIVPIYSVHEDLAAGVRAVCMPYFGGASLSRVLETVWRETRNPTQGRQLVEALAAVGGPATIGKSDPTTLSPPTAPSATGPSGMAAPAFAALDYQRAAAWIGARLAEGLQHAHDRGVLHCDIKPSNILLGADGQPMLLDFNLAQKISGDLAQAQATLGGTVAYMAPEHLRALATRDPALARKVDQRTDVYALGMVLFEMLTGHRPFDQSASYSPMPALIEAMAVERSRTVPSVRRQRPDVSWSLESIVRKCLAPDPANRYQQANHLAEDLTRFLQDRPLAHAPELSWRERGRKWVRRHPRLAAAGAVGAVALVLLSAAAGILAAVQARLREAEADRAGQAQELRLARERAEAARDSQALERRRKFSDGVVRALCLVNTAPDLHEHVAQGLEVCEHTLALYDILDRNDWQAHPDWRRLPKADRTHLAEDVRELLLLLARARVQTLSATASQLRGSARAVAGYLVPLASGSWPHQNLVSGAGFHLVARPQAEAMVRARQRILREALILLDNAEAIQGLAPSPALWEDRALYREQLGDRKGASAARRRTRCLPATGARDHYLLATTLAGKSRYAEAVAELNRALQKNPRHYWSWFQRGLCSQERGDWALAIGDFSACIVLWPEFAWGHFNRGRVLHQLGKNHEAFSDYTAALRHDPELAAAYLNRGLVALDMGRYRHALHDFDAAAARGLDNVVVHGGRGIALEHLGRHRLADNAFTRAWRHDSHHPAMLLGYGFAIAQRRPERAQWAFLKVLTRDPRNARALYGQGMLFSNQSAGSQRALFFYNQAVEADPTFVAARRGRALVLAHREEGQAARQDIEWCVATEPAGVTLYAAACVYALCAEKALDEAESQWTADRAVVFLGEAFAQGYGQDRAATDRDLDGIRRHPEFRRLVK